MSKIENWSVGTRDNGFTPPELATNVLQGNVYGDMRFADGTFITTSKLASISTSKKVATTHSGSQYELGNPSDDFLKFLENKGTSIEKYEFSSLC